MFGLSSIFLLMVSIEGTVVEIKHLGLNPQGWQVAQTSHFLIFHNQSKKFVEQVAFTAEGTRFKMSRKWFGNNGEAWTPKCEIVLYATTADYLSMTGVSSNSLGHTNINIDSSSKRVVSRRIYLSCDISNMLNVILPHEITHVLLAGQFGQYHVPRWADEGIAVLSEPKEKIDQHRYNLAKSTRESDVFGLKELMEMKNYPLSSRVEHFYAQSVCLTDFLVKEHNPLVFTNFIRDGLREGYDISLRRHYDCDFVGLKKRWQQFLAGKK